MTREELREKRALYELLEVLGDSGLPRHAPGQVRGCERQSRARLWDITNVVSGLMAYAGSPVFTDQVLAATEKLRRINRAQLWYRPAEGALPVLAFPCCEHCSDDCGRRGHLVECGTDGCPTRTLELAS